MPMSPVKRGLCHQSMVTRFNAWKRAGAAAGGAEVISNYEAGIRLCAVVGHCHGTAGIIIIAAGVAMSAENNLEGDLRCQPS